MLTLLPIGEVRIEPKMVIDGQLKPEILTELKKITLPFKLDIYAELSEKGLAEVASIEWLRSLTFDEVQSIDAEPRKRSLPEGGLANVASMKFLSELSIKDDLVSDKDLAVLKSLRWLRNLDIALSRVERNIWYSSVETGTSVVTSKITDAGVGHLAGLRSLRLLNLAGTSISDEGLSALKGHPSLSKLGLAGTSITGDGLVHLQSLPRLRTIDLGNSKVTDAGLANFAGSGVMSLSLRSTGIGDEGLANLGVLEYLTDIILDNTKVTDQGLKALRKMPRLHSVYLHGTAVTDAGLQHLSTIKTLRYVGLSKDTKVTEKAIEQLKQAVPEVNVVNFTFETNLSD